jgi:hypothetical protein
VMGSIMTDLFFLPVQRVLPAVTNMVLSSSNHTHVYCRCELGTYKTAGPALANNQLAASVGTRCNGTPVGLGYLAVSGYKIMCSYQYQNIGNKISKRVT